MDYPQSQWERVMRIQDVFGKAEYGRITWTEAAVILGVDGRTVRRWKHTVGNGGFEALIDKRAKRPSSRRAPEIIRDQVKNSIRRCTGNGM